jgi:pantoate--beta-alanine ligase
MFYLLILLLQMKLIKQITDLNKAINKEKELGFVPTMGSLHKGHEHLIKVSKKKCRKTIVSIFVNPTQFNNIKDYKTYPKNVNKDLKILRRLKVDYVFLPTVDQIYKKSKIPKILLKKSQKVLCAKFRKSHFEGVLDVLNRFVKLISPKIIFMGEKDYQQFFLVKKFIEKKYKTKVYPCETIRDSNGVALSSRNILLNKTNLKTSGLIAKKLFNLKFAITKKKRESQKLIQTLKKELIKKFNIKIEYLECRNIINLSANLHDKPFKLFIAYHLNNVRLIDNY